MAELSLFEWHPFSISSGPDEREVTIHVRVLGNWSAALSALSTDKAASAKGTTLTAYIEGPYGDQQVDLWGASHECFLLVAGGIGVTPMQSIARQLHDQHLRGRPLRSLQLIWSVRDLKLVTAMLDPPGGPTVSLFQGTEDAYQAEECEDTSAVLTEMAPPEVASKREISTAFEAHIYHTKAQDQVSVPSEKWALKRGRPDLAQHFNTMKATATSNGQSTVAVLVCGPAPLSAAVREMCVDMSDHSVTFECGEEVFEL